MADAEHECGVFGVFAPGRHAAQLTYLGLFALQHRGQESAGIAATDGRSLTVIKDMGLVARVFDDHNLDPLQGPLAIGHTRYSTTGASSYDNAQPIYRSVGDTGFALAHNGNLTNQEALTNQLGLLPGILTNPPAPGCDSTTDSVLAAELMARAWPSGGRSDARELEHAFLDTVDRFEGGFSIVALDDSHLVAARDPHGIWPLVLGRLDGGGWVVASETCALDLVGAHHVREVAPGEMIVIDAAGLRSTQFATPTPHLCVFEFVYFSRPDSMLAGRSVHQARQKMGEALAVEWPTDADLVMPVPESGIPAAQGYARASGIPYGDGLIKNRYVGRTFITPNAISRDQAVRIKLNPLPQNIVGKRLVVVDDSIVRGTTTRQLVAMLRQAGAREVHLRISSPPYRWPCYYGMDTGRRDELLAADLDVPTIESFLRVDSLGYLSLGGLLEASGDKPESFCTACLTGEYPITVKDSYGKQPHPPG